jgi:glycosyltransferase involved in cell wall biosynthesis
MAKDKIACVSIIVTTYNRPDALECVLSSLANLSPPVDEVVVADDGSGPETAEVIRRWKAKLPIIHAWQVDDGFRAAEARNLAVAKSRGDYLIFLDGDCMVFEDFVARHKALATPKCMVVGNRVLLSSSLTMAILANQADPVKWGFWAWLSAWRQNQVNRLQPLITLPGQFWRMWRPMRWKGVHTCNLGLWRSDFIQVNGFDESYQGWGHEDADLAIRMMREGVKRKDGQFSTPVLHLWHKENSRGLEADNMQRLMQIINGFRPSRTEVGFERHTERNASNE